MNEVAEFSWQEEYGDFSVSASNRDAVIRYVRNRQKHQARLNRRSAAYQAEFQLTTNVETMSVRLPEKWPFPQRRRRFEPANMRNSNANTNTNTIPPNTSHIDFAWELISLIG